MVSRCWKATQECIQDIRWFTLISHPLLTLEVRLNGLNTHFYAGSKSTEKGIAMLDLGLGHFTVIRIENRLVVLGRVVGRGGYRCLLYIQTELRIEIKEFVELPRVTVSCFAYGFRREIRGAFPFDKRGWGICACRGPRYPTKYITTTHMAREEILSQHGTFGGSVDSGLSILCG